MIDQCSATLETELELAHFLQARLVNLRIPEEKFDPIWDLELQIKVTIEDMTHASWTRQLELQREITILSGICFSKYDKKNVGYLSTNAIDDLYDVLDINEKDRLHVKGLLDRQR